MKREKKKKKNGDVVAFAADYEERRRYDKIRKIGNEREKKKTKEKYLNKSRRGKTAHQNNVEKKERKKEKKKEERKKERKKDWNSRAAKERSKKEGRKIEI